MGGISRLYDSDDCDGMGNGHPYHWDHYDESAKNILPIDRNVDGDLTDKACHAIASDLIPITIQFTAGLMCYFFKCINFNIALDILKVKIKTLYVYDDTDPCGSGEIYLSANLDNNNLCQIGGEFDLGSGKSKAIDGVEYPIAISNKFSPVHFYASAYDDDSNYFYNDTESLGNIDYVIDPSTLGDNPVLARVESSGGSGRFGLDLEISFKERTQIITSFESIIVNIGNRILKDISLLKQTNFNPKDYQPLLINLETMKLHGLANGDSRHCKNWEKISDDKKLELFMFEYELFAELDGKTMLSRIVEKLHGESSNQAQAVKGLKSLKGYCGCLKVGYQNYR